MSRLVRGWRAVAMVAIVVMGAGGLTACANAVAGTGRTRSASAPPTDSPSSSVPARSATDQLPNSLKLTHLLAPAPAGSRPWGDSWSTKITPTLAQFVAHLYDSSYASRATNKLEGQNVTGIAHRTWVATNDDQADEILLSFADEVGAQERFADETLGWSGDPGTATFPPPAIASGGQVACYYETKLDSDGFIRGIVFAERGTHVMALFFFSPDRLDTTTATAWAAAQIAKLPA